LEEDYVLYPVSDYYFFLHGDDKLNLISRIYSVHIHTIFPYNNVIVY